MEGTFLDPLENICIIEENFFSFYLMNPFETGHLVAMNMKIVIIQVTSKALLTELQYD